MPIQRLINLITKITDNPKLGLLKEPKQFAISVGLASVVLLLIYANFVIIPQITRVTGAITKLNAASAKLTGARKSVNNIPLYKTEIEIYKKKVDKHEHTLPAEEEIPSLLQNLAIMAKDAGIRIDSITPAVKKEESKPRDAVYQDIPVLITAKSGYHELGRFMASMEKSERFMKIVDIEIRMDKANPRRHDVKLLVVTYMLAAK